MLTFSCREPSQVEVEVQENAYAPEKTTVHSLRLAAEDGTREAAHSLRQKVATALRDPQLTFDHAIENLRTGVQYHAHRAAEAIENAETKTKQALSPTGSVAGPRPIAFC